MGRDDEYEWRISNIRFGISSEQNFLFVWMSKCTNEEKEGTRVGNHYYHHHHLHPHNSHQWFAMKVLKYKKSCWRNGNGRESLGLGFGPTWKFSLSLSLSWAPEWKKSRTPEMKWIFGLVCYPYIITLPPKAKPAREWMNGWMDEWANLCIKPELLHANELYYYEYEYEWRLTVHSLQNEYLLLLFCGFFLEKGEKRAH